MKVWVLLKHHISHITYIPVLSSSTSQGGGGSFKNRKPIGEVGCCESWMAEQSHWWTDGWGLFSFSLFLSLSLTIYIPTHLSIFVSIYLSVCLSVCLSIHPPVYQQAWNLTKPFRKTSWIFELNNVKNETILWDFFISWTWQHPKRSSSARLPSFKNGKLSAGLTASCQCVLRFFHSTCQKYCACQEKLMPGHTKCCTCQAKSS